MRIPGLSRAQLLSRRLRVRGGRRGVILLYHRIATPERDPLGLAVSPAYFAQQMEVLARRANPVPLGELVAGLQQGRLPRAGVAVTFDDAYVDNLQQAHPVLERGGLPATLFVPSGFVGNGRRFWWDELGRLLLDAPVLPPVLDLELGGVRWKLATDAPSPAPGWLMGQPSDHPRHCAYTTLHPMLKSLAPPVQEQALETLRQWAGPQPVRESDPRVMEAGELQRFGAGGRMEFGAHTVNHVQLSALPAEEQRAELAEGRAGLAAFTGQTIRHLAYPYGQPGEHGDQAPRLARELGYTSAVTTCGRTLRGGEDLFLLPRYHVMNWPGPQFERLLEHWLLN